MKSEESVKPTVALPKTHPAPPTDSVTNVNNLASIPEVKTMKGTRRQLPSTPVATKRSKIPVTTETPPSALPEESAYGIMIESPPDFKRKIVKRRPKPKTPQVARLHSNRQWQSYGTRKTVFYSVTLYRINDSSTEYSLFPPVKCYLRPQRKKSKGSK